MLDNDQIKSVVDELSERLIEENAIKLKDQALVRDVASLITNLLQNINDIAWKAKN